MQYTERQTVMRMIAAALLQWALVMMAAWLAVRYGEGVRRGLADDTLALTTFGGLALVASVFLFIVVYKLGDYQPYIAPQPPQNRQVTVNHYRSGERRVQMEQTVSGAILDINDLWARVAPEGLENVGLFRHYMQWLAHEERTPSMDTATAEGMMREQYRALVPWLVDIGWYTTTNRGDYDNRNGGEWTLPAGENALRALARGVHPYDVYQQFARPTPADAVRDTYAPPLDTDERTDDFPTPRDVPAWLLDGDEETRH